MKRFAYLVVTVSIFYLISAACLYAAPSIDFTIWELQEPDDGTITSAQLQTGYSDAYFYIASDGGQAFMDPQTGTPTSGSTHPRTELRELSGGSDAAWSPSDNNTMTVSGAVNQVGDGTSGHTTISQIFDSTGGFPLCEFEYYNSVAGFEILYEEAKGAGTYINLNTPMSLNTTFNYTLSLSNDVLAITINGTQVYNNTIGTAVQGDQYYFKCGNYDQTATSGSVTTTPYTVVEFYSIDVVHSSNSPTETPTGNTAATATQITSLTGTFTPVSTDSFTPTNTQIPPTATFTMTPTLTSTPVNTATLTFTFTAVNSATGTATSTSTVTPTNSSARTNTATVSPTSTLTSSASGTLTDTPVVSPTLSYTITVTSTNIVLSWTITPTKTNTPTVTATYTWSPSSAETGTNTPSVTPTGTPSGTRTFTTTVTPSASPTLTVTFTVTGSDTPSVTSSMTETPSYTATPTFTITNTNTQTYTPVVSATPTFTISITSTNIVLSWTITPTSTATATASATLTVTASATSTATVTPANSLTSTETSTVPSATLTVTKTASATSTVPSATLTLTVTAASSQTPQIITATSTPAILAAPSQKPVKLYPNPINPKRISDFIISYNFTQGTDNVTVKIYTVSYRLIKEYVFDGSQIQQVIMQGYVQCNTGMIADLSDGTYYYVVITENQGKTEKPAAGELTILK